MLLYKTEFSFGLLLVFGLITYTLATYIFTKSNCINCQNIQLSYISMQDEILPNMHIRYLNIPAILVHGFHDQFYKKCYKNNIRDFYLRDYLVGT